MRDDVITKRPKRHSGDALFAGTRVPVRTLFDYLAKGDTVDEFILQFPGVTRRQVNAVLQEAGALIEEAAPTG